MSDFELIFSILGEASTTEIAVQKKLKDLRKIKKLRKKEGLLLEMQEKN